MPVADKALTNKAMTNTYARDLFPATLEMMILESLRREPAHGYFGRILEGISLVLNPGKATMN
jgi:hypothetical protein